MFLNEALVLSGLKFSIALQLVEKTNRDNPFLVDEQEYDHYLESRGDLGTMCVCGKMFTVHTNAR